MCVCTRIGRFYLCTCIVCKCLCAYIRLIVYSADVYMLYYTNVFAGSNLGYLEFLDYRVPVYTHLYMRNAHVWTLCVELSVYVKRTDVFS